MKSNKEMDLDELMNKLGGISKYQICICFLATILTITTGPASQINVFIGASPKFRCRIAVVDDAGGPEKVLNITEEKFKLLISPNRPCLHYDVNYTSTNYDDVTKAKLRECHDGYHYDTDVFTSTVTSQYDIICNNKIWMTIANSIYFIGYFIGSALCGPICDWFGRKRAMIIFWALYVIFQTAIAYVTSFEAYAFLRIMVAVPYVAIYITVFTFASEMSPVRNRTNVAIWVSMSSSIAHTSLPLFASLMRDWRKLELFTGLLPIISLFIFFYIPESPRWLIVRERSLEARVIVQRFAHSNGTDLLDTDWTLVVATERAKRMERKRNRKYSMIDLFRAPRTRAISIAVAYCWFTVNFVYYGLILNVGHLAGDIYFNGVLNAGIEILGNFIVLLVPWTGKRNMTSFSYLLSGVACLSSTLFATLGTNQGLLTAGKILAIIGKMGAQASFLLIYSVTADIYPTILRGTGIGLGSMTARVGGIATPFTVELQQTIPWLTQTIFGVLALVAAAVCIFFPETEGSPCLNSLHESETFFRHNMKVYNSLFERRSSSDRSEEDFEMQDQCLSHEDDVSCR